MAFIQILFWKFWILRALILDRLELVAENLLYRQQLMSQQRGGNRPKIEPLDRMLWALVARVWSQWTSALIFVQPATVIGWQRAGWKLFWRWKSKPGPGRPRIDVCVRELIRRMSRENPTWGSPRIVSELALLGHTVCEDTVLKYMVRTRKPPSQNWRTFLDNHLVPRQVLILG